MYSFEEQNFIHPFIPSSKGSSRFIRETMIVFLGNIKLMQKQDVSPVISLYLTV